MAESISFVWKILQLDRRLVDGVVQEAHYSVKASNGVYSKEASGSISLSEPEEDAELTAYSDLTEEWVVNAIRAELGEEQVMAIESALKSRVEEQAMPVIGTGLPWVG